MDDVRKGFAALAARYFGKLPGQSLSDFAVELKALSDEDVAQLRAGLEDGSLSY